MQWCARLGSAYNQRGRSSSSHALACAWSGAQQLRGSSLTRPSVAAAVAAAARAPCRVQTQQDWVAAQVAAHPADPWWVVMGLLQAQADGMYQGYAAAMAAAAGAAGGQQEEAPLSRSDLLFLNSNGEAGVMLLAAACSVAWCLLHACAWRAGALSMRRRSHFSDAALHARNVAAHTPQCVQASCTTCSTCLTRVARGRGWTR